MKMLLLFGAIVGLGCVKTLPERRAAGDGEAVEYFPLRQGASWTYQEELLGQRRQFSVTILKQVDDFFVDSRGNNVRWDRYGLRDDSRYLLRFPLDVGNSWQSVVSEKSIEHYRIVEVARPCEVPAGSFRDCLTVDAHVKLGSDKALHNTVTFARNVGIVRIQTFVLRQEQRFEQSSSVLVSYDVSQSNSQPKR